MDEVEYMFMTAKAIRGRESATKKKWEDQGWELVGLTQGTLRTEMQFRRPKPKGIGAFFAQAFSGVRDLDPKRQKALLGLLGFVVVLLIIGGIAGALTGEGDAPTATSPTTPTTASETPRTSPTPTEEPSTEPTPSETPEAKPYVYKGPKYEVITVDDQQGPAKLRQYWILTAPAFDFATEAYKKQIRSIIADIAQEQGTSDFIANVVTNEEIAEAESPSTQQAFIAQRGDDYFLNTIPKLEVDGWVANYTGGFNPNTGKPSDAASAYEVIWRPYATSEIEQWKPEPAGS